MKCDGRDDERIKRAVEVSRKAFGDVRYPQIDITNLSVDEAVSCIIKKANLKGKR